MAVKKLYTESWIADIADALRTVIGGTDTYNTREMAATLATIHRGAKDVWIGTQFAYNQLETYDVEICYIIIESGQIVRCYAGTTIIYDVPIIWDYSLTNEVFPSGRTIDTNVQILKATDEATNALAWEYYLKAVFPASCYNVTQFQFETGLVFNPRWQVDIHRFNPITTRGQSIPGIPWTVMPQAVEGENVICWLHATKNANDAIYWYWVNDDGSETFLGSNEVFGTFDSARNIVFNAIGNDGPYTLEDFRFRFKT